MVFPNKNENLFKEDPSSRKKTGLSVPPTGFKRTNEREKEERMQCTKERGHTKDNANERVILCGG